MHVNPCIVIKLYTHTVQTMYAHGQHSHLVWNIPIFIPHIVFVFNMNKLYRFSIKQIGINLLYKFKLVSTIYMSNIH